jgi:hypothetical protein
MAVVVVTSTPKSLLSSIIASIEEGSVTTWSHDADGDFTHTASQWVKRAWFRPRITDGQLVLNIFPARGQALGRTVYGIYHGRFIEMLLNHFDERFTRAWATAMPEEEDRVEG